MTSSTRTWCFSEVLRRRPTASSGLPPITLVILNQPIRATETLFPLVWRAASLVLCADGGANRLYDAYKASEEKLRSFVPRCVCGDLDSLRPEVGDFYSSLGCEVEYDEDQETTDFVKCLEYMRAIEQEIGVKFAVVAYGALGGRFDQSMANLNQLFHLREERNIYLMSEDSVAFLLWKGRHAIKIDKQLEGPTCGLIPIAGPVTYSTHGLRWNLDSRRSEFGGLISSSNQLCEGADTVEVTTDGPLVWTSELQLQAKRGQQPTAN